MCTLYVRENSEYRVAEPDDVFQTAQALMAKRFRTGSPVLGDPARIREFLKMRLASLNHEVFGCIFLDARKRLICAEDIFRGTSDTTAIYVREVIKLALQHGAAYCIAYHNHPSGNCDPSEEDQLMTQHLKEVLLLVRVKLIDHLIVGESVCSFMDRGFL